MSSSQAGASSAASSATSAAASSSASVAASTSAAASSSAAQSSTAASSSPSQPPSSSTSASSATSLSASASSSSSSSIISSAVNTTPTNSSGGLSTGAIVGIVVGVIGGLVVVGLLWRWFSRRRESREKTPLPPPREMTYSSAMSGRQRAASSTNGMNRASSYSTLLGPAGRSVHSRQPSLSSPDTDFWPGAPVPSLIPKSSVSSLNKVDEHGLDLEAQTRSSPLATPSETSAGSSRSRTNSPHPTQADPAINFIPAAGGHSRNGSASSRYHHAPAFQTRPDWRQSSISSLSSAAGGYGVTHTGKLVSVQMPKRLGASEQGDFFGPGGSGDYKPRVPSGITRWRDDLQAPSMAHTRAPSTLSINSPAVSTSGQGSSDHGHSDSEALRRDK